LLEGNGVFLSPHEEMIVASSSLGRISACGAINGSEKFQYSYVPKSTNAESISSGIGISFSNNDAIIFSVAINQSSLNPLT
jgi:hypothetical protein